MRSTPCSSSGRIARARTLDLHAHARLAQHDLVARLQTQPFRAPGDGEAAAAANHTRALRAAVIVEPVRIGRGVGLDAGVAPGDALIDVAGPLTDGHLVGS